MDRSRRTRDTAFRGMAALAVAVVAASTGRAGARPVVPPVATYTADNARYMPISVGIPDVEGGRCPDQRFIVNGPAGRTIVVVRWRPGKRCAVWLGGETRNPNYSGLPATYCELNPRSPRLVIRVGEGGPAAATHPDCAPTGFPQTKT